MKGVKLMAALLFSTVLGVSAVEVINEGHSGWNTRQLRQNMAQYLEKSKPDLVILMAGTNDNLNSRNLTPPEEYRENLRTMVKMSSEAGAKVILAEIPNACEELMRKRHLPGFFDKESAAQKVKRANRMVAEVAAEFKAPLLKTTEVLGTSTLEAASLFRNPANSKAEDGVHPTAAGYVKFAEAAAEIIREEKLSPRRILCVGDSITYGVNVKGAGTASPDAESYPGVLYGLLNTGR